MDITNFMTWFVSQCVDIFTWFFNILDSITFAGTSLLRVLVTIVILVPLLGVVLTLVNNNFNVTSSKSEKVSEKDGTKVTDVR